MVSAISGVLVWKEFTSAPANPRKLIPLMFGFFLTGLVAVAVATVDSATMGPHCFRGHSVPRPGHRASFYGVRPMRRRNSE
jgi:hypothetical protein